MPFILLSLSVAIALASCGEKIPLPSVNDDDGGKLLDTTYVAILPHWTEAGGTPFRHPFGITVGYDRTIYVCDTDNDRIVRLDPLGNFIESFPLETPVAVAQDRGLNLAAVNRRPMVWVRMHRIGGAFREFVDIDSTYMCRANPPFEQHCWWHVPSFEAIAASLDVGGRFYAVAEAGVHSFIAGLPFLNLVVDSGVHLGQVYNPTGLAFAKVRNVSRLIVSQYPGALGVQYLTPPTYRSALDDENADLFHMTLDDTKYVAADELGNVFVLHRANSIVMMFDKNGRYLLTFGDFGDESLKLYYPSGIAVFERTVLIADTRNNRIARYQMTAVPQ